MNYDDLTRIRVDLDISAQRFLQQVCIHNEHIEKQIAAGLTKAFEELTDADALVDKVAQMASRAIESEIREAINSWTVREKVREVLEGRLLKAVERTADEILNKINE